MSVIVVGLSHKTAVTECRAKLTFPEDTIPAALGKLMTYPGVTESLIVSTCNRVEIYASVKDAVQGMECRSTSQTVLGRGGIFVALCWGIRYFFARQIRRTFEWS